MDQEMEADEFFPDKLIETADVAIDDIGEDTDAVKEKDGVQAIAGESVVNGNDEGRDTEEMDTDEPMSGKLKIIFFIDTFDYPL